MNAIETRVTTTETDIGILDVSMNAVETRVTTNETDIGILDVSMNAVETRVTINETDIGILDVSMNAVETRVTINETDIGILDVSMNAVETRVTINETDIGILDVSMNAVETRVTTNETDIGILDVSMNAIETRVTTNETDIGVLDVSMNAIETRVTTTETDIGILDVSMNAVEETLVLKANLASPTFTGIVSAPTQVSTDNTTKVATTAYVKTVVGELVDGAPGTIDTLNELAAALGDDPNFATTVTNSIASKATIASPTFTGSVGGITKTMVGLSNVDNTTDALKPVSTAQQTALDLKANIASPTFTGTVSATSFVGDGSQLTGLSTSNDITGDLNIGDSSISNTTEDVSASGHIKMFVNGNISREGGTDAEIKSQFDAREHHIYRQADYDVINFANSGAIGTTHRITFGYTDELYIPYPTETNKAPINHAIKFEVAPIGSSIPNEVMRLESDNATINGALSVGGSINVTTNQGQINAPNTDFFDIMVGYPANDDYTFRVKNTTSTFTSGLDVGGDLSVGGELTINDILTFDKAKCKTTGEIFEDNIRNSTALATGTWHRIMTAGNNVGGTLVIALSQSGRHCYYEIKFSNCFWEESSLRVVNHHTFGFGGNVGVSAIRVQSDTGSNYSGTAFDIYYK